MNIKVNDKVRVESSMGYLTKVMGMIGTVIQVYDFQVPMAVVKFENGITAKVEVSNLIKIEEQENQGFKPVTPEIPEGAKQITKADFMMALTKFTNPIDNMDHSSFIGAMVVMIVGKNVAENIFKDQDSVVMTENQFVAALWNACNPENVADSVDKEMGVSKCMRVSITAIISLENIVGVLFSDDSENV